MAIRVALNHRTKYQYARDVWLSPHVVRLRPAPHTRTPIVSYSLKIKPKDHFINWQQDPYANNLARLVFPKKTREFEVEVDLVAEMTVINPFDFFVEPSAEKFPFDYEASVKKELAPYLEKADIGPKLTALATELKAKSPTPIVNYLVALNSQLQQVVGYTIRLEPGIQTPEETLTLKTGSCRDSAWLFVQLLRQYGLAARFVSGYLIQLKADVKAVDGPSGASEDFCDLHAWTEVYLPGAGWVGFDPTSGLMAGEGHIPLACSAEPSSAAAISGGFAYDNADIAKPDTLQPADLADGETTSGGDKFEYHMGVTRLHEDPRVTKPYTDDQWNEINRLGMKVDVDLARHDVRLTMGGEPTFVGIDNQDAAEWNSDALGDKKLELGEEFLRRLWKKFAPGGFLHHGQGKWYPGEVLPRWAYGIYWRKDGKPIWRNPSLIADPRQKGVSTTEHAQSLITKIAQRLGIDSRYVMPGYEDAFYYAYRERRLPSNVSVAENHLASERERERLAKIFETGLDKEIGYALPLKRNVEGGGESWISSRWYLRGEKLFMVPGDSPIGLRLPLDSIPWVAPEDAEFKHDTDPFEDHPPLADSYKAARGLAGKRTEKETEKDKPEKAPAIGESAKEIVRTTLCVQVRDGHLRVFFPPVETLEDYLTILAATEDAAAEIGRPVLIEGYTPPYDARMNNMAVTPDPGVIEINTLPAKSWDMLVRNTNTLYDEARQIRLGTEKFLLDGRHVGTGGGNHIVMGGEKAADSPFLRRPDLLKSMIGYWQNHPALSYLFSGMFVGPTSQAPRVDEARNDQIYELELAFEEVDRQLSHREGKIEPWLVDRIFRNLLIDSTGNTHRAEFCIDKLYSPDSATGRLGLLEMRGFEMPPHAQMSLVQHLLLRSLVSMFWQKPHKRPLVRWRTELHDRFMLPYFVKQDLEDVLRDLSEFGYDLKPEWFATHLEFRFAHLGTVVQQAITMEIRQAIEPWHVLGESNSGGGTVRYVDSSVERVQVLVSGIINNRHAVTCNGKLVPLQPTGVNGEYVAGVRYRAWQPASCLHPTIPVHSPLTFDLIDTWNERSVGGCVYHVSHPGGRSYDVLPINAYEAESRRINRFYAMGHTPGKAKIAETKLSKEFPFTLDLRHN